MWSRSFALIDSERHIVSKISVFYFVLCTLFFTRLLYQPSLFQGSGRKKEIRPDVCKWPRLSCLTLYHLSLIISLVSYLTGFSLQAKLPTWFKRCDGDGIRSDSWLHLKLIEFFPRTNCYKTVMHCINSIYYHCHVGYFYYFKMAFY